MISGRACMSRTCRSSPAAVVAREAREDQEEALSQLRQARDELEAQRERLEEERRRQVAAVVLGRLQTMLSEAKLIRAETRALDAGKSGEERGAAGLSTETIQEEARGLARRERSLQADADELIQILDEEGSSLVAPPVLRHGARRATSTCG